MGKVSRLRILVAARVQTQANEEEPLLVVEVTSLGADRGRVTHRTALACV